ncbi:MULTISPECIES: MFS transporter [unclassified Paraburkholderia]|jgi:DHA1 family bicyclomycin/chloramphenicol resistance-like MFS transporter|uniref:MFS transporter n=1 Tax=unclassified Paraburkholderia TaxID=2615204 RepID=UPI0038BDAAEC
MSLNDPSSTPAGTFPGAAPANTTNAGASADVRHAAEEHGLRILAILSLLMAFASISTDLYLPALPSMALALHADAGAVELTISGYLIGFSLGQLLWGPVGDRYGRRVPIAIGLVLFVIGSAGCALSTSAPMLVGWRIVQAVGACASVVLARAMVRDLYTGHRAAQMMSTLMTVMAIAPLLGPSVGGLILHVASWRDFLGTGGCRHRNAGRAARVTRNPARGALQPGTARARTGHLRRLLARSALSPRARAPCRRSSGRASTGRASSDQPSSASSPMARPGRWAPSSR